MVNWLLLLVVCDLAASVATGVKEIFCLDGLSSWKLDHFKKCKGDIIRLENGNGTIDLSTWSDNELIEIFSQKDLYGGFIISNSQITGKDVLFTVGSTEDGARIVIENNLKLEEIFIDKKDKSPLYIRVSGNRHLQKKHIMMLKAFKDRQHFRSDSHIQAYHECDLNGAIIKDVKSELANCSAIYGDLVFDANTKFPQTESEWKSIEPLKYVEGCLRIIGTGLTNWEHIAFLKDTTALKGCKAGGHEISGNEKMCIQPDMAHNLKGIFSNMVITGNQKCTPECSSRYLHDTGDKSCVIITGPLIINENTTESVLQALGTVEEIRGNLQMTNTNITDFNYLPKLKKLNTEKIESGPVISIQWNKQLKSFDLPSLNETGLIVGRDGQLKYEAANNDYYQTDPALLTRLGATEKDSMILTNPPTTPATTTTTRESAQAEQLVEVVKFFDTNGIWIMATAGFALILGLIAALYYINRRKQFFQLPEKWKWYPMGDAIEQTDIYKYEKESDWHKEAKQLIEKHKPDIEKNNLKHKNNRTYEEITFNNHMTNRVMPGVWQLEHYKTIWGKEDRINAPMNKLESEADKEKRKLELSQFPENTMDLPAGEDGVYGLAFRAKIASQPKDKYRTRCDECGYLWFELKLPPIYPEYFESTAKLMAKLPCDMIDEKIGYMKDKGIPIEEFGLVGKKFKAAAIMDGKDPVPSRAKQEKKDIFWLRDRIPQFKIHRYREKLNSLKISKYWKISYRCSKNRDRFICRLVETLMNLPTNNNLELTVSDVDRFLKVIQPRLFEEPETYEKNMKKEKEKKEKEKKKEEKKEKKKKEKEKKGQEKQDKKKKEKKKKYGSRPTMSAGESMAILNKTHVRIVGEIRGDFDALRRAINIPSLLNGDEHPLLQYNWVFLGNYTGRHPQSLETIMFLLALQFLYGRDCIVLLRGIMEFKNTSEKYGFKDNLIGRFGDEEGLVVWEKLMKAMSQLPLNCKVLYGAYCSSGGFTEDDIPENRKKEDVDGPQHVKKEETDKSKKTKEEPSEVSMKVVKKKSSGSTATKKESSDVSKKAKKEKSGGPEKTKKEGSDVSKKTKKESSDGSKKVKNEESNGAKETDKEKSGGPEVPAKRDAAGKDKKEKKNASSATSTASTAGTPVTKGPAENTSGCSTTPQELDKLFSLPNATVRDYLENPDTGAGYYYGERVLEKIANETEMGTFFSTLPMTGGVGLFSDSSAAQLITISSVRHLHGHGGQKTLLAAVAEINGDTEFITLHMILHEDEMFYYDPKTGKLEEKKKGKKGTSSTTSPATKEVAPSTSQAGNSVESAVKNKEEKKIQTGSTTKTETV